MSQIPPRLRILKPGRPFPYISLPPITSPFPIPIPISHSNNAIPLRLPTLKISSNRHFTRNPLPSPSLYHHNKDDTKEAEEAAAEAEAIAKEIEVEVESDQNNSSPIYDSDFPASTILSAYKAKVLPFNPTVAAKIIQRYLSLREESFLPLEYEPQLQHGVTLCKEFQIPPTSLFLLAYALSRTVWPKAGKYYWAMGNLMELASEMGVSAATVFFYIRIKTHTPAKTLVAQARREVLKKRYYARLSNIVITTGDPAASHLLAETYEEKKLLFQAKKYYQQAGEGGIGESWLRLGLIHKREGNLSMAKELLKNAMEFDVAPAFYEFVLLDYPALLTDDRDPKTRAPLSKEHYFYLLKAASSGCYPAVRALGNYFDLHKENRDSMMAKEWHFLAAASGQVPSMLNLARIFKREGNDKLATEWEEKAARLTGQQEEREGVEEDIDSKAEDMSEEAGNPRMRINDTMH